MISNETETQVFTALMWIVVFMSGASAIAAIIALFRMVFSDNNYHQASEGCDDEGETPHKWGKWLTTKQGLLNKTQTRVCQRCGEYERRTLRN